MGLIHHAASLYASLRSGKTDECMLVLPPTSYMGGGDRVTVVIRWRRTVAADQDVTKGERILEAIQSSSLVSEWKQWHEAGISFENLSISKGISELSEEASDETQKQDDDATQEAHADELTCELLNVLQHGGEKVNADFGARARKGARLEQQERAVRFRGLYAVTAYMDHLRATLVRQALRRHQGRVSMPVIIASHPFDGATLIPVEVQVSASSVLSSTLKEHQDSAALYTVRIAGPVLLDNIIETESRSWPSVKDAVKRLVRMDQNTKATVGQVRRLDGKGVPTELGEKSSETIGLCISYRGGPRISEDAPKKWNKPRASCDLVRFAHEYEATLGSNPYAQKPIFTSAVGRDLNHSVPAKVDGHEAGMPLSVCPIRESEQQLCIASLAISLAPRWEFQPTANRSRPKVFKQPSPYYRYMKPSFITTILFIIGVAVGAPYGDTAANSSTKSDDHVFLEILDGHRYPINNDTTVNDTREAETGQVGVSFACLACIYCVYDLIAPPCWPALAICGGVWCDCCRQLRIEATVLWSD
ncbi:hypothetical protein FOZ61_004315 [Perkinsus olseni]|uniref:Uncharacterized protein n=1 Tax=Perkinsus olseni TaxID=32597 RepID=A0A7J6LM63_PEROL|nr:hypothetical protein FOZ61_004315 [Perkinsus olseni]